MFILTNNLAEKLYLTMKKTNFSFPAFALLALLLFGSSACEITPPPPPSVVCDEASITIEDSDYFNQERTLTNRCELGPDYIFKSSTFFEVQADLIIEPGTIIQFEGNTGLAIQQTASITANGTATEEITLMRKGIDHWRGVIIYSNSSKNRLNYVTIEGGGQEEFNSNGDKGNLVIYGNSKASITNCTFRASLAHGINCNYTSAEITNLSSNKFEDNVTPLLIRGNQVPFVDKTNQFPSNTNQFVEVIIGDEIGSDQTWQALDIPYRWKMTSNGLFPNQVIGDNSVVTIEPGTSMEFAQSAGLRVEDNAGLKAVGTASKKIVLTGTTALAGAWSGIEFWFTNNVNNEIAYTTISYAGSDEAAIYMWGNPTINVHDMTISDVPTSKAGFYDAPKTANDAANPNLTREDIIYTNVATTYQKGS